MGLMGIFGVTFEEIDAQVILRRAPVARIYVILVTVNSMLLQKYVLWFRHTFKNK